MLLHLDSHTRHCSHGEGHSTLHASHHTHAARSSHWVLNNLIVLSHILLILVHHLLVASLWEPAHLLLSHVWLAHERHLLLLIHSTAHLWIEVTTTWILVAISMRGSSHHLLIWHVPASWGGWHCRLLIWHWSLAGLRWWLVLLGHLSLCVVL